MFWLRFEAHDLKTQKSTKMPVTPTTPGPYTATSAVLEVITRYRSKGLPSPVSSEVLARAGVSESLIPRTLQSLQTLDLIDDKGAPTATLEGLRLAPEAEFKKRLHEWLSGSYAEVLRFVDPATASEVEVRDAFRNYTPVGQQPRMVTLFQGLFAAAGVAPERSSPRARVTVNPVRRSPLQFRTASNRDRLEFAPKTPASAGAFPPALAGLLATLPAQETGWTKEQRDRFVSTFSAVLDYTYPTVTSVSEASADDDDVE